MGEGQLVIGMCYILVLCEYVVIVVMVLGKAYTFMVTGKSDFVTLFS